MLFLFFMCCEYVLSFHESQKKYLCLVGVVYSLIDTHQKKRTEQNKIREMAKESKQVKTHRKNGKSERAETSEKKIEK